MICGKCGTTIPMGQSACPECGEEAPVPSEAEDPGSSDGSTSHSRRSLTIFIIVLIVFLLLFMGFVIFGLYATRDAGVSSLSEIPAIVENALPAPTGDIGKAL